MAPAGVGMGSGWGETGFQADPVLWGFSEECSDETMVDVGCAGGGGWIVWGWMQHSTPTNGHGNGSRGGSDPFTGNR